MLHDNLDLASRAMTPGNDITTPSVEPHGQAEVSRLLAVIADQISEADRRHCEALDEMKARLYQLGTDARVARAKVPHEFAPSFARIEDALSQLAERMAEARAERTVAASSDAAPAPLDAAAVSLAQAHLAAPIPAPISAPMALRSAAASPAAPAFNWAADFARNRMDPAAADPFDIIDNGVSSKASEVWSEGDAEALTRVYEDATAHPEPMPVMPVAAAVEFVHFAMPVEPVVATVGAPAFAMAAMTPKPAPQLSVAEPLHDRLWLEGRFADLAERLQASLDDAPVHSMLIALDDRLVQLEQHFGLSLQDVAKRSDVEGLRLVEAHIEEIARHLEQTQGQLGRLDGIEAQLHEVVEHLAAQFDAHPAAAPAMAPEDFQRMADTAASTVAMRFAATAPDAPATTSDDQIASVRGLLESYIGERRNGDEHNALMLDTLQQALIRVLDRMDAMEQAQEKVVYQPAPAAYSKPQAQVERQRDAEPMYAGPMYVEPKYVEPKYAEPKSLQAASPFAVVPGAAAAPSASDQLEALHDGLEQGSDDEPRSMAEQRTGVERLRQDFVADAQRAKLRASAAQAELAVQQASAKPEAAGRGRTGVAGAVAAADKTGRLSGLSPKLVVAAIALIAILGVGGMWSLGSSSSPSPAPVAAGMPSEAAPVAAVTPAPVTAPAPDKPTGATPNAAAPKTGESTAGGFVFEVDPPDETMPAPSKISTDPLAQLPPGIRLRQSAEPVSPVNLAILQHQQYLATLSNRLGESAANTLTPASFMREVPIAALPAVTAAPAQPGASIVSGVAGSPDATGAKVTDVKSSALDLPPVTVGPLSLRLAAAKGDASAEFEAASRLAEGKGTAQNFKEAMRWYQRSASQGFAQAQYRLGTLYERGLGIKADTGIARSWYERAADQGNVKAMHNLAVLSAGRVSGSPDYMTAAKWFTAAAERDLQDSQYNLGVLYESGLGVEKDAKQAMKWFSLAARNGDAESVRRRDMIKAQLAPQDQAIVAKTVAAYQAVKVEDPLINDARAAGEDWKTRMGVEGQG